MNHDDIQDDPTPGQAPTLRSRRWIMTVLIAGSVAAAAGGSARIASAAQAVMDHHGGQHGAMDPAAADRHIGEMVDRVLADGTPEQKTRLAALIRSAHAEMGPVHEQLRQAHERAQQLLMQPRVDRAALESLRAAQMRQLDAASQRLVQRLADAAEILTPEQRARLFQHMQGRMH